MSFSFALEKQWQDVEAGIEAVEIRYACAMPKQSPDWSSEESRVLVPHGEGPFLHRKCSIELPCGLADLESYDLHYYFHIIRFGRQQTLPTFQERIVSKQVAYLHERGSVSSVGVQWVIGDGAAPNYTVLTAEALVSTAGGRPRRGLAGSGRLFTGLVWGPAGATISYSIRVDTNVADDGDRKEAEGFWDNSCGRVRQVSLS